MILSPQQQAVMNRLAPIVKIATDGSRAGLPLKVRTHSLIMGPSGSGKTHLARFLGKQLGLPVLVISSASWIIIASRSEPWTWTKIVEWLAEIDSGILVIDEVEKCRSESSPYEKYAILEAMELLDGNIPVSVPMPSLASLWDDLPAEVQPSADRGMLERKLRERVMIVGCGAWQTIWTRNANAIGFSDQAARESQVPSPKEILSGIDPEFRQRFRAEVAVLQPMSRDDYETVAQQLAKEVPLDARPYWNQLCSKAIDRGIVETLGMRVFEELLLDSLIQATSTKSVELRSPGVAGSGDQRRDRTIETW